MTTVSKFIDDENQYERQLALFMGWDFVENQQKGSSYDFVAPDGSKLEAKFDWDSIKTGNHYLEIAQTNDNKKTWEPSGFSISADCAKYWIVINEDWLRIYQTEVLRKYIRDKRAEFQIKETRFGVNFNHPEKFSRAYIIPFTKLDIICMAKFPSPIKRKKK